MLQLRASYRLALATAMLSCSVGVAHAQSSPQSTTPPTSTSRTATAAPASQTSISSTAKQLHDDMMSGMTKMHEMKSTGDADKDYAHMMEHHHEQAIKMTQTYLKGAKNPQLKAWAQKSMQSQQKELDELKKIAPKD